MTSRRGFIAGGVGVGVVAWVVPEILTMQPASADTLHSPPPVPRHEQEATASSPQSPGTGGGVLAFTGAPVEQETVLAAALVGAGLISRWVAKHPT